MKIALCISGNPTQYRKCFFYIHKNFIEGRDVDVFLHAWTADEEMKSDLIKLYQPKAFCFMPQIARANIEKYSNPRLLLPGVSPVDVFGQHHAIKKVNDVRKQYEKDSGIKYDIVARCRFDLAMEEKIPYDILDLDYAWFSPHGPRGMPRDFFAISDSKKMDVICSVYENIESYYNQNTPICGEEMLFHHLATNNIPIKTIYLKHGLYRPPGHHQGDDKIVKFPPITY